MKRYESLMLITSQGSCDEVLTKTEAYLRGGGKWVQLRLKDVSIDERMAIGAPLVALCRRFDAVCIINDSPEISMKLGADGVHLGKQDMPVGEARLLMGPNAIVGGTANTLTDMVRLANEGVDYIGLGPFRFTTTKKNLSPVLGLDGYSRLMTSFRRMGFTLPVTAIGGILPDDIELLMTTGITGIAVSGCITGAADISDATEQLIEAMNSAV